MPRTKKTATTSFGSPGRIGHDASAFYSARLYEDQLHIEDGSYVENPIRVDMLNTIIHSSSESMKELPDSSVHLMVTSPPYNVGKEYDADMTLGEFLDLLRKVWAEVHRVLVPGGRACINVANLGRKPYIPLHAYIIEDLNDLGFLMRGEVIWNKAASASSSTAWGSWQSASNPTLRDVHEYILVFSKGGFGRDKPEPGREDRKDTITKEEFLEFTKSVWDFPTESAKKIGHPAPFPMELPYRCIQLYTFLNEIVLDPFMGSGQTALAARRAGRHYVGYELNEDYVKLARSRIEANTESK